MDRWLFSFILGAILSLFLPIVPPFYCLILMIITALAIITLLENKILAFFLLGAANSLLAGHDYNYGLSLEEMQTSSFYRQSHLVEGEVISLVSPGKSNLKINFRVDTLDGKPVTDQIIFTVKLAERSGTNTQAR